jgi:hypothetical protein
MLDRQGLHAVECYTVFTPHPDLFPSKGEGTKMMYHAATPVSLIPAGRVKAYHFFRAVSCPIYLPQWGEDEGEGQRI